MQQQQQKILKLIIINNDIHSFTNALLENFLAICKSQMSNSGKHARTVVMHTFPDSLMMANR
jgi:hypothetical protein